MKCLVTGAPGFAGSHLCELLVADGAEVVAVAMPGESLHRIEHLKSSLEIRFADVADPNALAAAGGGFEADVVFHLAALASVPASFDDPKAAFRINTLGTVNLLDALKSSPPEKFIYISTAEVYGRVRQEDMPIRETEVLKPANPYSASKAAAEVAVRQCWRTYAFPAVVLRPFNHTGPRQGPGFAPSDFAGAVARIEKGLSEPRLAVGNLESSRDFTDVRDMVRAYALAARFAEPGEVYNISSGKRIKIADVLDILLSLSRADIEVVHDPARSRPSDTPVVVGDSAKFRRRTGWQPEIPVKQTLSDLLDSWREAVG